MSVDPTEPPSTVPDGVAGRTRAALGPGTTIGRFAVREKLGEGGMGVVYAAYDAQLDRPVAIKLVLREASVDSHARLLREAQAMAKVAHPNVVPIYEVGEHASQIYIAMELVDGEPLSRWQRRASRTWQEVLAIYVAAGRGLAAAHSRDIIHRDFKPDNVLVGRDGRPRVLDFGLARAITSAREDRVAGGGGVLGVDLTAAGSIMGTPTYMSPEHFRGEGIGPASDQFAFAVAVYRALFDQQPFPGESFDVLRMTVCAGELQAPPAGHEVPAPVVAAVLRALATEPADRFPTIDELLVELERPLQADPSRDVSRGQRARRIAAVLLCAGALASSIGSTALSELDASPRWLFLQSSVVMAVLGLVGVGFRKRLVTSAHNRRVGLVMLVTGGGFLVHRALAWWLGAPALDTLVADAVLLGVVTVIAGIVLERWMAYGGPIALAYLGLALAAPSYAGPGFSALVLVYAAGAAWRWGR